MRRIGAEVLIQLSDEIEKTHRCSTFLSCPLCIVAGSYVARSIETPCLGRRIGVCRETVALRCPIMATGHVACA